MQSSSSLSSQSTSSSGAISTQGANSSKTIHFGEGFSTTPKTPFTPTDTWGHPDDPTFDSNGKWVADGRTMTVANAAEAVARNLDTIYRYGYTLAEWIFIGTNDKTMQTGFRGFIRDFVEEIRRHLVARVGRARGGEPARDDQTTVAEGLFEFGGLVKLTF